MDRESVERVEREQERKRERDNENEQNIRTRKKKRKRKLFSLLRCLTSSLATK